jgi:hypothetical protein
MTSTPFPVIKPKTDGKQLFVEEQSKDVSLPLLCI